MLSIRASVLLQVNLFGFDVFGFGAVRDTSSCFRYCRANFSISRRFPCRNPTRTNFFNLFFCFSSFLAFSAFLQWPSLQMALALALSWPLPPAAHWLLLQVLLKATLVAVGALGIGGDQGFAPPPGPLQLMLCWMGHNPLQRNAAESPRMSPGDAIARATSAAFPSPTDLRLAVPASRPIGNV